jgi:DNA-binding NtrC family response regulator
MTSVERFTLLVIDDDPNFGRVVVRALSPSHRIRTVASVEEALHLIAAGERFDLVLCQLMPTGVSGMDFHERVGSIAPEMVERIVFTTAGGYAERAEAFLARADIRHIDKPFTSINAFRAMVRVRLAQTVKLRAP